MGQEISEAAVITGQLHFLSASCVTYRSETNTLLTFPATAMPGGLRRNNVLTLKVSYWHASPMPPLAIQAL